jgi:hypothetical protein
VVRTIRTVLRAVNPLIKKKFKNFNLLILQPYYTFLGSSPGGCPRLSFPVSIRLCQNSYLYTPR